MGKWTPFPFVGGAYTDSALSWAHQDTVNYLPVLAERSGTRGPDKLAKPPGAVPFAMVGSGPHRGARNVESKMFVVSGNGLYEIRPNGTSNLLGIIPGTGRVSMTHNQVKDGNQLAIGTGAAGYVYDTTSNPEDDPGGDGSTPVVTPGGGAPSPTPGTGGGYPDDSPPTIPLPTVFGSDVILNGDFSSPTDIDAWAQSFHGNDNTVWDSDSGTAHYLGQNSSTLYYDAAIYRMSPQPLPRYSVTVTADVSCDAGVKVAIGCAVSFNTSPTLPGAISVSDPTEHLASTPISYTFDYKIEDFGITAKNEYVYGIVVPVLRVVNETGTDLNASFDNVTMTITALSNPVTTQTLTNLDLSSGKDGWSFFPPEVMGVPLITVAGGEMSCTTVNDGSVYRYAVCNAPITLADLKDKYIHFTGEVWCNDPATYEGVPRHGVALGLATSYQGGPFNFGVKLGALERGDWTAREAWFREFLDTSLLADITLHLCIKFEQDVGKTSKIRNMACAVTNSAVT